MRVVEPENFGAALQYFTGSQRAQYQTAHHRACARVTSSANTAFFASTPASASAGARKTEMYAPLGIRMYPPELREDRGEIELGLEGVSRISSKWRISAAICTCIPIGATAPRRFAIWCWRRVSAGMNTWRSAITPPGAAIANGLTVERLRQQMREIRRLNEEIDRHHHPHLQRSGYSPRRHAGLS